MHVEPRHTKEELAALIRREPDAKVAMRMRGVLLAMRGRTNKEIGLDLSVAPRSTQNWVRCYNARGIEGLRDKARPGQPKKLSPPEEAKLIGWLESGPDLQRDGVVAWRGTTLKAKIQKQFGKKFSLSGAYSMLHRLGYEPLRPRPIHRKADLAGQEEFKKSAPLFWRRSDATTPARSSRSGGRTR